MFKKKSTDAEGENEKKGKKKKQKKPKPTAQEKAVKNKQKVEKQAASKIKAAEAKIKKAEQAEKNKAKAAEKKIKDAEKKEEKFLQKEQNKVKKKEEKKEKKAQKKIRNREKKIEKKAQKLQRKAELAARTPFQKKVDRNRKIRKFLIGVLVLIILAGAGFGLYKFGPMLLEKLPLPEIHISEIIENVKEKIPFLNKSEEEPEEEQTEELNEEETPDEPEEVVEDDPVLNIAGGSLLESFYTEALAGFMELSKKDVAEYITVASTSDAYSGLINGDLQVIFASVPGDKETKQAALAGVDLQPVPIINGGLVFFTNKNNSVKNLTESQLYNIYAGNITNWKEVGGPNKEIVAYQRPDNVGAQSGIYKYVISDKEIAKVSKDMKIESTKDLIKAVEAEEGAIGFSYYYYVNKEKNKDNVKLIPINSIKPSEKTIASAEYPLTTYTYAVITTDENSKTLSDIISSVDDKLDARKAESDSAQEGTEGEEGAEETEKEELPLKLQFVKWILSDEGQKLVEKHGFIRHDN